MARKAASERKRRKTKAPPPAPPGDSTSKPTGPAGLPLPSPVAATNLAIANIVLSAAGGMLRDQMEKRLLVKSYGDANGGRSKARKLVDRRSLTASVALWGASHIARRSPLGLAVVCGGLAAKVFYDRGKRLEAKRHAHKAAAPAADNES